MVNKLKIILVFILVVCASFSLGFAAVELDANGDGDIDVGYYDEADLEGILDLPDLQGLLLPAQIADWYEYINISVASFTDGTSAPATLDVATRVPYAYRTFADDADEDLNIPILVPADLSGTTVQFRVYYIINVATGPSAEGVAFGLSGASMGDNDATNATKGTVVVVTDTLTAAQWDIVITDWSGDVTITDLAAGEVAELALIRDVSDAADNYAQDVGVMAVQIRYVKEPAK